MQESNGMYDEKSQSINKRESKRLRKSQTRHKYNDITSVIDADTEV